MKIAIFHDYFGAIGGGEKTVLTLAEVLRADIITTDTDALQNHNLFAPVTKLHSTIKFPPLKQVSASVYFNRANFMNSYDFFIFTGNWSIYGAKKHIPNLWYCFTPVRSFYDLYHVFHSRQDILTRSLFTSWVAIHRPFDQHAVRKVNSIVSISNTVANRVQRYYGRESSVIYPPIDVSRYRCIEYGDFWLSVNRIYPEKRIELQIEAFREMPDEHLIIVGGFSKGDHASRYADRIFSNLPKNVTFMGEVNEIKLLDLYARCKGHITTAMDEDYGLTPLEAMASGKPVVAVNEGGYRETVTKETGCLVPANLSSIKGSVEKISSNPEQFKNGCMIQAVKFDLPEFSQKIKTAISNIYEKEN